MGERDNPTAPPGGQQDGPVDGTAQQTPLSHPGRGRGPVALPVVEVLQGRVQVRPGFLDTTALTTGTSSCSVTAMILDRNERRSLFGYLRDAVGLASLFAARHTLWAVGSTERPFSQQHVPLHSDLAHNTPENRACRGSYL